MEQLAIEGGIPIRNEILSYGHQWVDDEDICAVVKVLKSDWITQGPKVEEFEKKVAEYCDVKYAVAVSSGTAALHAACVVAGISNGDEVITTPITFAATANAIVYCGGKPVFADIDENTFNIDPKEIQNILSSRTKAILSTDFAGHPTDIDEITALSKENDVIIIDDACHALGAEYKGLKLGSLADMTILSFHPVKHITTGEGGMVLTNSIEYYEKLKVFRHHGIVKDYSCSELYEYEIRDLGYNYRLTDFQCALGISQLNKLDQFVHRRREIAKMYNEAFAEMKEIIAPIEKNSVRASYHIYVIQLQTELIRVGRREIFNALRAENIGVNVHYMPLHLHSFYQREFGYKIGDFPKAESYYERAITLPIFPKMSDEDANDVIEALRKVVNYYRR
ncbi:UDP-4-amino-4,6-dideoxy-N-acetyl-beta-L-altrosamine transaminase [Chloroflexota bacterium]